MCIYIYTYIYKCTHRYHTYIYIYVYTPIHIYTSLHFTRRSCGRSSSVNHLKQTQTASTSRIIGKAYESSLMSRIKSDAIPAVNKRSCKIECFFNYGSDGSSVLAPGRDGPCLFSGTRDGAPILPSDLRTSNVQSGPGAPTEQTVPVVPGTSRI